MKKEQLELIENKNGITLIALVITIIVLLILAGVTISVLTGDNGLLTHAKDAGNKNKEAKAMEEVQIAWTSTTSEYYTDWETNSSIPLSEYRTKAKLDTYLVGKGSLEGNPKFNKTDKVYTVNYKTIDQNELYTFLITEDGKISKKTGVVLGNSELIIEPGETAELTVKFVDMAEGAVTWSSSDTSVATVNDGVVTGIAKGEITITARCNDKSDTCSVLVVNNLATIATVGDYVDIGIGYLDQIDSNKDYRTTNKKNAWRVLGTNQTEGIVNLISTSFPLAFYHPNSGAEASITEMNKISTEEIELVEVNDINKSTIRGYTKNGFFTEDVKSLFNNSKVFSGIQPAKWGNVYSNDIYGIHAGNQYLLPCDSVYWLATKSTSNEDCIMKSENGSNGFYSYNRWNEKELGIRICVSLVDKVKVKDGNGSLETPFELYGID